MKAVIFDFNGTLFNDHDKHVKAWSQISMYLRGKKIDQDELYNKCNGVCNKKIIQYLSVDLLDENELEAFSNMKEAYYRKYCQDDLKHFHLIEGATKYFEKLKQDKIPFTIASASIKTNIDFFIKAFALDKYMNVNDIVYDDGTYLNKVGMFKTASNRLNVDMKDCLVFEDSVSGIQAAYQAGCRNIVVVNSAKQEGLKHYPGVIDVIDDYQCML